MSYSECDGKFVVSKIERKRDLIQTLSTYKLPLKLGLLAEQFECSVKTIRRDIEELVMERSAPWFVLEGKVYLDQPRQQQIELDGYWFTSEELFSLLALYKIIEDLSEGLLAGYLTDFKQRVLQVLGPQVESQNLTQSVKIIPIASPVIQSHHLNKITRALAQKTRLNILFWNRHLNEFTQREISPYQLVRYRDHWLVDAYCHERKALRSFSLEAIKKIDVTTRVIEQVNQDELSEYYQSSYGVFSGLADKIAILQFSAYQARWIKDQAWHPQQTSQWLEDGRYQLHLPYREDIELIQDILKYGTEVEIISPLDLRQKVHKQLQQMLALYQ